MNPYYDTVTLNPGQSSITVRFPGGTSQPKGALGNVMRSVTSSTTIDAIADWKTITSSSCTFYFSQPIPSDGTIYKLFYLIGV